MNGRTWAALVCACVAVSACGGQQSGDAATRSEQAQVRRLLPDATHIRCARSGALTRCEALVSHPLTKAESWTCELTLHSDPGRTSYAATRSCWSDDGRLESLRSPTS
jgi:hypothetical protein